MPASRTKPATKRSQRTPDGGGNLLRTKAYAALKSRILSGELAPGAFLSERQAAGWLSMSKTPVRAAFERLESEGFISISPQQGVVVRDLSVTEIADHFELRAALECFVVGRLAESKLNAEQRALLDENLEAQRAAVKADSVEDQIRLDREFHLLLCRFLGNEELIRVMAQMRERIMRVIQRALTRNRERFRTIYPEHRSIAEAIYAGNRTQAAELMRQHLENGMQTLMLPSRATAR